MSIVSRSDRESLVIRYGLVVLLMIISAPAIISGGAHPEQRGVDIIGAPRFLSDYAVFSSPTPSMNMVEIYIRIPLRSLYTVMEGQKDFSEYEMAILVRDNDGKQVTGMSWKNRLENPGLEKFDHNRSLSILERKYLELPKDKYTIEIILTDQVSNLRWKNEINLNLKGYESPMLISDIEFTLGDISQATIVQQEFLRHGQSVVPSASRTFDSERDNPGYYLEIYPNKNSPDIFGIRSRIFDLDGTLVYSDSNSIGMESKVEGVIPFFGKLLISNLAPKRYQLKLEVGDRELNKIYATRNAEFNIDWSLKTLVENDYGRAVDQLRYVASPQERDSLKNMPADRRLEGVQDYWKRKDPTPTTPENELSEEYYSRLRYANNNFSGYGRPGYLTDFGRIYITYGQPEEIERHPFDLDSKPYEIWYYYRHHRKFIFIDKNGFGNYELAYPYPDGLKLD